VVSLLIRSLTFDECGSLLELFTQSSGCSVEKDYYWASIYFYSCIHLQLVDVVIFDPIGYALVGYNVMGNSSLENVTVAITKEFDYTLLSVACNLAIHGSYHGLEAKYKDVFFSINVFMLIDKSEPHICFTDKSMIHIKVNQFSAFITIVMPYGTYNRLMLTPRHKIELILIFVTLLEILCHISLTFTTQIIALLSLIPHKNHSSIC